MASNKTDLPDKTELIVTPARGKVSEVDFAYKSDWIGNARLYDDLTNQAIDLEDLAGLDEDKWMIVGMDLHAAGCRPSSTHDNVYLHVVDLEAAAREGRSPLQPNAEGKIPVISVLCHELTLQDIFNNMVDAQISFRINSFVEAELDLVGYADRPTQAE